MSVKTNSPVLAQGLCWMYHWLDQPASVYVEQRGGRAYYQLNLARRCRSARRVSTCARTRPRSAGSSEPAEDSEFVFDLETESGVFCAGVGRVVVHNSERRGLEFVTRKVTHAAARSSSASPTSWRSATSTPSATGATPGTTSRRCG